MPKEPLINILVRVSRPQLFEARCLPSVQRQQYGNWQVITHYDGGDTQGYDYNLFCNNLKEQVKEGWFFFLDDDDILVDQTALKRISAYLLDTQVAVICQMLRNGKPKPTPYQQLNCKINRGHIGMPCIFLHSDYKHVANFTNYEDADYRFIRSVINRMPAAFCQEVVVDVGARSHGARNPAHININQ